MKDIKVDKIIRSKRKTIALIVTDDATLVVREPMDTTIEYIEELVSKKRCWIKEKKKLAIKNGVVNKKEFVNGEGFLYLGEIYILKLGDYEKVELMDTLRFPKICLPNAKEVMIEWYKQKAFTKISDRASRYSKITGWKYKSLAITNAQRRWGSCGPRGTINFSWKLIMAPLNVVDYVVVHELVHLTEKNHSVKFWNKVRTVLPDYEKRERWLKENGKGLMI